MADLLPFQLNDPTLLHQHSLIHGHWTTAATGQTFDVVDPGTGEVWAQCPDNGPEDVDAAVVSAHQAFLEYGALMPRKRAQLLLSWHSKITSARDDLAKILTYETGKPLAESYGESDYSLGFTWWFAGEAERIHGSISASATPDRRVLVIKQPLGVAVALAPWNFPIAMILRKLGAALAACCTMVAKPSPESPLTCLALADLALRAGFPPGVFNVLTTSLEKTLALSEAMCVHPLVKKVTFTGSTRLGGNCPFVIFDDADLDHAVAQLMLLKWRHAGQACISANRVYIQAGVYDEVITLFKKQTSQFVIGHGATAGTTLGAVTVPSGLDKAEDQVEDAVSQGASIVLGTGKCQIMNGKGYFFAPTILTGMTASMKLSREETFGPLANDTSMGLATYVFSRDSDRLWRLFEQMEAGMIGLNTGNGGAAESPCGGIKESGYGKESGKDVAVNEYLISKTGTLTVASSGSRI
uniref:Aldehyde dehydrogenase domain-containing protein n=1 Tax=Bionectria ochroleuca TaxID=29856 RepID=A0A8H7NQG2_BIOOC